MYRSGVTLGIPGVSATFSGEVNQAWSHSETLQWGAKTSGTTGGCFYGYSQEPDKATVVYAGDEDNQGLCGPESYVGQRW